MSGTPLRIANCSGFYGDRVAAAREMVDGGPIDVLTGDWLAELTMLILAKTQRRDPEAGFARTFVTQMADVLGDCAAKGIKVVSNAGGLNPAGCAAAVRRLADESGLDLVVAHVEGDDVRDRYPDAITANAYLGAWGIVEALNRGADVVITGRVTDAAVVVGPAAWHHGWARTDWDELAAGVVAGHLIECGCQVTGGNYAFFTDVPGLEHPGFPIAEIAADGSFVITKHPGTGGLVSVGTVTAQLLYEIQGTDYHNPDATVRLNSIRLDDDGPDRVRVHSVRGLPGPETAKVALNRIGGYRNEMTFGLTGLGIETKAALAERALWAAFPEGRATFDEVDVQLRRYDDGADLRVVVTSADRDVVGRAFTSAVVELTLANYPGLYLTTPPGDAREFGVYEPAYVATDSLQQVTVIGDERIEVPPPPTKPPPLVRRTPKRSPIDAEVAAAKPKVAPTVQTHPETISALLDDLKSRRIHDGPGYDDDVHWHGQSVSRRPLGTILGARSGDKGGDANIGVWATSDDAYDWLQWYLSVDRLRALLPAETLGLEVERYELPNIRALNFIVRGLLGRGVAASTRVDPQAKGLGELLRSREGDIPDVLLP